MRFTRRKDSSFTNSDHSFPTTQLFVLAICRVAEPIALTSIFPYSWLMVRSFHVGDKNDASLYAGILISAFALAESLTGMWWGGLSDRIGRKPVLLLGCVGTMLSLLIVGFSTSLTIALLGRVLGGVLNGNIGVIQTMVGELVKRPEHEPKAFSVMPFVWSIGTIIGPAIGGTFASPAKSFPSRFSPDGLFGHFPWLLPNLICAGLMMVSILAGYFWLEETHPHLKANSDHTECDKMVEQTPIISGGGANQDPGVDMRQESYGTFNEVDVPKEEEWYVNADGTLTERSSSEKRTPRLKWFTRQICMLVVAMGIFTFHSMSYDHLLPIFLQDDRVDDFTTLAKTSFLHVPGGLGLSTQTVGLIMSVNGIIALFVQAIIFPIFADRLGVWKVFVLVTILHPLAYFVVPYIALLPESLLFMGIYACLTIRNLLTILAYPVILILLKQASPSPSCLGKINGLAASVGAACRTVAPPVAGLFYSWGLGLGFTGLAWWWAGFVAMLGAAQIYLVPQERNDTSIIRSIAPCLTNAHTHDEQTNVVYVQVADGVEDV